MMRMMISILSMCKFDAKLVIKIVTNLNFCEKSLCENLV
jgi:hypothetical protein